MKESISYSFLLNIIITFVFICFAVIMGIFSYYRAFRANTAILNAIEKYEGYNCLSIAEASNNLKNIGYNPPFKANYKEDGVGTNITKIGDTYKKQGYTVDSNDNLVSNGNNFGNLGYSIILYQKSMDDSYDIDTNTFLNRQYQYGVFTYMYMDLPVINSILKIPVYGKTNIMSEFRILGKHTYGIYDKRIKEDKPANTYPYSTYSAEIAVRNIDSNSFSARVRYKVDLNMDGVMNSQDTAIAAFGYPIAHYNRECGTFINYKMYGE